MTFQKLYRALRRKNRRNYALLAFCDFISVLLITSYAAILRSPTMLNVLPEGGDSRKQIYMVFALAAIGCAAFTLYAANLFFRFKSREMGIFMALGAPKALLRRTLYQELALLSALSCGAGAALGVPLAMGVWQIFRALLASTDEMRFHVGGGAFLIAAAFSAFVILALFILAARFIRRTDILDIITEQRKSEPVRRVPRWFGWAGILLAILGGVMGYGAPVLLIRGFHYYPWGWENIFYLPLLAGVYMILLHTVVNGWRGGKGYYRNIITFSMMKFQGRQTVGNMLVMTLLLAGAYFASFYTPVLMASQGAWNEALHFDGLLHYPAGEDAPGREEILAMAAEEGAGLLGYYEAESVLLGVDGEEYIEEGNRWHSEYQEVVDGRLFFSESAFRELTGETVDLAPGELYTFLNYDGAEPQFGSGRDTSLVTNTVTGERLEAEVVGALCYSEFAGKAFLLDDGDYARLSAGLPEAYREIWAGFNIDDASYAFARRLYDEFLNRLSPDAFHEESWNRIGKAVQEARYGSYFLDYLDDSAYAADRRDTLLFRLYAKYRPILRVLEKEDALEQMAVFVTVFLYVAVVCYLSVVLIGYTRCKSIALRNRQVYEDLRRLGANRAYLYRAARGQVTKVYLVPAVVGTTAIYALFGMILFANDGMLTSSELLGLLACAGVLAALSFVLWACCRVTLRSVCKTLGI